jgi:hypothetical protein
MLGSDAPQSRTKIKETVDTGQNSPPRSNQVIAFPDRKSWMSDELKERNLIRCSKAKESMPHNTIYYYRIKVFAISINLIIARIQRGCK